MGDPASKASFVARAEGVMSRLETAVDGLADDFDIDVLRAGNIVTLAFDNGHRIVVNTQEAASEIWVAARSGGFHYRWDEAQDRWIDTRSGDDLRVALARLIGLETGSTPTLNL